MTIVGTARVAALICIAVAASGCGRASSSTASSAVVSPAASRLSTPVPAADAAEAVKSLQADLARVTAERDAARAQLDRALTRERELEAELAHYRTPVTPQAPQEAQPPEPPGQQTFKTVSTTPSP